MMQNLRPYSYDMDAIMGMSREQLESVMRANEHEVLELYNENTQLREKIKKLEVDVRGLVLQMSSLERVKIEHKASKGVWQTISVAMAAIGAIFGAIFFNRDNK